MDILHRKSLNFNKKLSLDFGGQDKRINFLYHNRITSYVIRLEVIIMADYPDWVLKHKVKDTYINCVKGKYYLYVAHSERIKGTDKVKRICDGYLGRITPEKGLIPPKDKVNGSVVFLEYGLSSIILSLCTNIHKGMRRSSNRAIWSWPPPSFRLFTENTITFYSASSSFPIVFLISTWMPPQPKPRNSV